MQPDQPDIDDIFIAEESNPRVPRRGLRLFWVLLAVVLVAAAVFGAIKFVERFDSGEPESVAPSVVATTAPTAAAPSEEAMPLPTSCDELYTDAMRDQLDALPNISLNPEWYLRYKGTPEVANWMRDGDRRLATIVDESPRLTCAWVPVSAPEPGADDILPEGINATDLVDSGLVTTVVSVTPEQSEAVLARLQANTPSCYEQRDGIRCTLSYELDTGVLRQPNTEGASPVPAPTKTVGESHFVRDNLWFATRWYTNVDGYTLSMVDQLFGDEE